MLRLELHLPTIGLPWILQHEYLISFTRSLGLLVGTSKCIV